ncbi:hypothetical protein PanWU01x14_224300 [Parasponia andersonii]|uniref:Uncharacterized protein n=1 Tax=Parasponia andersonii TaxID=3476 RepID=A0A2P5BNB3_PARAD|nr:hypothetical protein PanWU01x14_224300 [Parasponia andersonii]
MKAKRKGKERKGKSRLASSLGGAPRGRPRVKNETLAALTFTPSVVTASQEQIIENRLTSLSQSFHSRRCRCRLLSSKILLLFYFTPQFQYLALFRLSVLSEIVKRGRMGVGGDDDVVDTLCKVSVKNRIILVTFHGDVMD